MSNNEQRTTINPFTDQLGNSIRLSAPPKKIISLVPSQTELLFDLGLNEEVIGITRFCVHPQQWLKEKAIIGGTKKFLFDKIDELSPDLIIGNKEENYKEGIQRVQEKYPVWMSEVTTLDDAIAMIQGIGDIVDRGKQANNLVPEIIHAFERLKVRQRKSVLYLIWKNPWMAAGRNTFIHSMLERLGLTNCLSGDRYPEVTIEVIQKLSPELILLSSEPYPFNEHHAEELRRIIPSANVQCVDGEMFSWYGSRLKQAPGYFNSLVF